MRIIAAIQHHPFFIGDYREHVAEVVADIFCFSSLQTLVTSDW
jgi:hypothetical protein